MSRKDKKYLERFYLSQIKKLATDKQQKQFIKELEKLIGKPKYNLVSI